MREFSEPMPETMPLKSQSGAPLAPASTVVPGGPTVSPQEPSGPTDLVVEAEIVNFAHRELVLPVGATVMWVNQGSVPHTTSAGTPGDPTGEWNSGTLSTGDSFSFTFEEPDVFPYFCRFHEGMLATVTVGEAAVAEALPRGAPAPIAPTVAPAPAAPVATPAAVVPPTAAAQAAPDSGPVAVKLKTGNLRDQDAIHKGSGVATIYRGPDGEHLLRLENLDVTNGPDLHVILTPNRQPSTRGDVKTEGWVDFGSLKGNRGNQNYPIPEGVDVSIQRSVVIYCAPFHVIFSVAELKDA